jgi:hypothetical protein
MAGIVASRKSHQRRACLVASALVSALVLFVAGSGWALTGSVSPMVARVNSGTMAAAPGAPRVFSEIRADLPVIRTAGHTHRAGCHKKKPHARTSSGARTACR